MRLTRGDPAANKVASTCSLECDGSHLILVATLPTLSPRVLPPGGLPSGKLRSPSLTVDIAFIIVLVTGIVTITEILYICKGSEPFPAYTENTT